MSKILLAHSMFKIYYGTVYVKILPSVAENQGVVGKLFNREVEGVRGYLITEYVMRNLKR